MARQLSLRRFHKDAFCRNDEVKRRPILSCRKAAVGRVRDYGVLPGFGSSEAWASRRARGPARSSRVPLRPFGPTLSASLRMRASEKTAGRVGGGGPLPPPARAGTRHGVSTTISMKLRVEPVAEGEGRSTTCRRRRRSLPSTEAPSRIGSISTSKGRPEKEAILADPYELDNKVKDQAMPAMRRRCAASATASNPARDLAVGFPRTRLHIHDST